MKTTHQGAGVPPFLHQRRFIKASWRATLPDEADEFRQRKQALQQKGGIKAIVIDVGGHPSRSRGSRCSDVRSGWPSHQNNMLYQEMFMNELIELGVVAGEQNHEDQGELIELGSVVSETKAHNHGTLWDGVFPTTSP
ncbi:hypothetical protein G6F65_018855 [Rhizopus arrhizus]|nr:hypothetical protein G6F65_018855 [Rhizopus arrhizus]KAG1391915.1 hypothetical protein G6F59_014758 [Rhizopus arrhizus]